MPAARSSRSTPPKPATTHTETEGDRVTIDIPDHPARAESAAFGASKRLAKKIQATIPSGIFGTDQVQMHHGGSLWVFDDGTWRLFLNTLGMEWSSQFCADPPKVDILRMNAQALYRAFPLTIPEMVKLGYRNAAKILDTPIIDADGVATWVDSIFNSCVPLPAHWHTGTRPSGSGEHHYPRPITNIQFFKRDDFKLWHDDPVSGTPVAVVPTGPRGKGVTTVEVVYAQPGTALHETITKAHAKGMVHELGSADPISKSAYKLQTAEPTP